MWIRSSLAYRTSFVIMTVGSLLVTALDFLTIAFMFVHIDRLGGFTLAEIALLYGTASTSMGLADLALGSFERIGTRIRDGSLDVMLVRPASVLAQAAADRFALRRVGRVLQGLALLGWGAVHVEVTWTVGRLLWLPVTVVAGSVIFGAVFVLGGAFQFWARDAREVQSAFTYGGQTMLQYPPTVFARELVRGVTFLVPLAFVNWIPAMYLLGRPEPIGLPGWAAFVSPLVALAFFLLAWLAWRTGLRGYQSTGS
ncbi:ABC transporter permease [Streptomyces sp. NPDC005438]|uniref:ABC transporter permease n=1 Tax=Streptomyces sp. NPDC005438 TaxID=3156880 RepID=UPI0033BE6744